LSGRRIYGGSGIRSTRHGGYCQLEHLRKGTTT
jgi:hypothetical protein